MGFCSNTAIYQLTKKSFHCNVLEVTPAWEAAAHSTTRAATRVNFMLTGMEIFQYLQLVREYLYTYPDGWDVISIRLICLIP